MTNVPSGVKRSWEGEADSQPKRAREEPRDWRDVHLKPGRKAGPPGGDRRDRERERDRDARRPDSRRGDDYRRGSRRDDRRPRRPSPRRHSPRRSTRSPPRRSKTRSPRRRSRSPRRDSSAKPSTVDDEKEEGEISPRSPTNKPPSKAQDTNGKQPDATADADVETVVTPPPAPSVEETLAQRRAKRQAILAKYAGIASIGASASPSPGPSNRKCQQWHSCARGFAETEWPAGGGGFVVACS
ncbi:hypothetical protein K523DRAFT_311668 [Schizophyllum commune Tattone D]|nr:hypothetical protein K523DRAFT_311668 [Schizophyllum commune Tattone D]